MHEAVSHLPAPVQRRRAYWLRTLHRWHWISAALCLVGMLLFSVTGITLNHAGRIGARADVTTRTAQVPGDVLAAAQGQAQANADRAPLPAALAAWLDRQWGIQAGARPAEWDAGEIYLSLPRPGGDAWVSIDVATGEATWERTDRGWLAWANDLHKGRNAGPLWGWFIDLFAVGALVFSITGLVLLQLHARQRRATWPMVALGLVVPLLIVILFVHA
ncbi:PepSY-associated TM helix domain-containing protein [Dokdonella sp.]|uniref:PepSY-associated TM helix domain-containing protein n=1 Tax=Dokdonella sp. TaxID=2291710 RepID=UPI0031C7CE2A|nr:PepSY-associated TM helix domain-containing protein [Dokdonella sp.]